MKRTLIIAALVLLTLVPSFAGRRDPLTAKETDDIREVATEPEKRLPLYVRFAGARLETVEHLRSDPRFGADRGPQIHDLLEDFTTIIDELGDNIDEFVIRKNDIRKPLKTVIEQMSGWQLKLRAIKESKNQPAFQNEFRDYEFVLDNAVEAVNGGLDSARKTLQEQEAHASELKKAEKEKK
jgi:hypothetical protein